MLQLTLAENSLQKAVDDLKWHKQIIGTPLTLEEMLNPIKEREVGDLEYRFEGGKDEIVDQVNHKTALKRGEIGVINSDDEEEDEQEEDIGTGKLRSLCEKVECLSLKYGDSETCLDLS